MQPSWAQPGTACVLVSIHFSFSVRISLCNNTAKSDFEVLWLNRAFVPHPHAFMFEGSISVHSKERVTQMVNIFTTEHQQWTPYHWFRSLCTVLAQLYIITLISFPWVSGQLRETLLMCLVKSPWHCWAIAQFSYVLLCGARSSTLELVWAFGWRVLWFSEMYFHQMYKAKIKILLGEDNICLSCQAA